MIPRLVEYFLNLHLFHSNSTKTLATFQLEAHSKLTSNAALSTVRAHDAKLVFSFLTLARSFHMYVRKCHLLHNLYVMQ